MATSLARRDTRPSRSIGSLHTHTHTHTHSYRGMLIHVAHFIGAYIHTHIYPDTHTHTHTHTHTQLQWHARRYMLVCSRPLRNTGWFVHVYFSKYMCVCKVIANQGFSCIDFIITHVIICSGEMCHECHSSRRTFVYVCVCMYVLYVRMYISMYVCMYKRMPLSHILLFGLDSLHPTPKMHVDARAGTLQACGPNICIYIYIYTYIHTCPHYGLTYINACIPSCIHTRMPLSGDGESLWVKP
jgi:hypothetical protein